MCKENGFIDLSGNTDDYISTKSVIKAPGIDPEKIANFVYRTQLEVNFVNNGNLKNNRFDVALPYLKNVIDKYPNHAYGHYYYAKCIKEIGELDSYDNHINIARDLFSNSEDWKTIAKVHGGDVYEFSRSAELSLFR